MSNFNFARPLAPNITLFGVMTTLTVLVSFTAYLLATKIEDGRERTRDRVRFIAQAKAMKALDAARSTPDLFRGTNQQDVISQFQQQMQDIAKEVDLSIEVISPAELLVGEGLLQVELSLSGVMPENRLPDCIRAIVNAKPPLAVSEIQLRRAPSVAARNGASSISVWLKIVAFAESIP